MNKEIKIPSQIESISLVENMIDEISMELSLVTDLYGNIIIGVIEGVTNAIIHGNSLDKNKYVSVVFNYKEPYLNIKISDEGLGFMYDNIPDPTKIDNIEKPDGRGVFLMKHLADEVSFDRGGATVNLKFKI
jgi:serine/threonine-protein kinase RsbW